MFYQKLCSLASGVTLYNYLLFLSCVNCKHAGNFKQTHTTQVFSLPFHQASFLFKTVPFHVTPPNFKPGRIFCVCTDFMCTFYSFGVSFISENFGDPDPCQNSSGICHLHLSNTRMPSGNGAFPKSLAIQYNAGFFQPLRY